ncbi:PHD-finger domain-containing protein [Apiospora arundinis]
MATFNEETTAQNVIDVLGSEAKGKTFVITGPSQGGIGASAAIHLAKGKPERLVLAGRSLDKIQPVIDEIKATDPSVSVDFVALNLLDRDSVRQTGEEIKRLASKGISGLINNAGIMAVEHFTKSKNGVEGQFETNHVGHFLLTSILMPEIKKAKGVVVNVSSLGYMYGGNWDLEDTDFERGKTYDCWEAYGRSKLANVLFSIGLAKRMAGFGGAAFSVNPGFIPETKLLANSDVTEKRLTAAFEDATKKNGGVAPVARVATIEQGAANLIMPALNPDLRKSSGAFITECAIGSIPEWVGGTESAEKLWHLSEKLIGQKVVI